jgi:hypothetical protein
MMHQNLSEPASPALKVYRADGVTPVNSGDDMTALWSWTGSQFSLQLQIKNTGTTVLNTGLNTTMVPANWMVLITGNGTLLQGNMQTVTLTALPPLPLVAGTASGDFDLWFTG